MRRLDANLHPKIVMTSDIVNIKRIDEFIAQYDGKGDILKAYQRWVTSPKRQIVYGKDFVAYPPELRKDIKKGIVK